MNINERAMLVTISTSYWSGKVSDDTVDAELTKAHDTEADVHEYRKWLVKKDTLKEIKGVRSQFRNYLKSQTSPWLNDGTRILSSALYFDIVAEERKARAAWDKAVGRFIVNYPKMKLEARKRLGTLYREGDYPSVETLRKSFDWGFAVFEIPSGKDWRVDLGDKETERVKKQIESKVKEAIAKATEELWKRLYKVVKNLADKLKDAEAGFRDSIIGNIQELVSLLPKMNVGDDPKLEAMRRDVEAKLCKLNPETLREDDTARGKAADAADALLKSMEGYLGARA